MATTDTRGFLAAHHVFTVDEFRDHLGTAVPRHSVWSRLAHAEERGWVERVTRGVYLSRVGLFADHQPDRLVVASRLAPDAVLVYHSALEAAGVAHSVFFETTVSSTRTAREWTFENARYRRLRERPQLTDPMVRQRFTETARRGDDLLLTASRERTFADCLDRPDLSGGLEEVLRSLGGLPSLRVEDVLAYLDLFDSPTMTARVAWVLGAVPDLWRLTAHDLKSFRDRLGSGPYYVERSKSEARFVNEWRLYVPADLDVEELLTG